MTPITLSSTFVQQEVGKHAGYEYARSGNPTRRAYEECLASLEGATHGFAFASGMAAEDAVLRLLEPGQRVIIPDDTYGGTFRLVSKVLAPAGVEWTVADLTDLEALEDDWPDGTALVWVETPTNPTLTIVDILGVCAVAHERGARVVVDNTFATPFLQRPLELGADIVVHSATKYLGGHSDVIGGFVGHQRPRDRRTPRVPAERGRRGAEPVRLLPGAARAQDARRAHGAALLQRAGRRHAAAGAPRGVDRALPGHPRPSRPRDRARARCATSAAW